MLYSRHGYIVNLYSGQYVSLSFSFLFLIFNLPFCLWAPVSYFLKHRSSPAVHQVAIARCNSIIIIEHTRFFRESDTLVCIRLQILRCYFWPVSPRLENKLPEQAETITKFTTLSTKCKTRFFWSSNTSTRPPTLENGKTHLYTAIFCNENTIVYLRRSRGTRNLLGISYSC